MCDCNNLKRGPQGPAGPQGEQGPQGLAGPQGLSSVFDTSVYTINSPITISLAAGIDLPPTPNIGTFIMWGKLNFREVDTTLNAIITITIRINGVDLIGMTSKGEIGNGNDGNTTMPITAFRLTGGNDSVELIITSTVYPVILQSGLIFYSTI